MRWILDRQYRRFQYVIPQWFHAGSATVSDAIGQGKTFPDSVGAHRPLVVADWPDFRGITSVRDSMKRVVSHWAHVQAEPGVWLPPEQFDVAGRSLLDLLDSQPLALFDNNQVRYLSGAAEYDGMTLTSRMEKGDLQKALDAVHGGLLAAPVDDFDAALLWWAHELDWSAPYYRRINVRKKGAVYLQLTASELSALESWNRLDASLVEEVGVVFREKIVELEKKTGLPIDQQREAFRRRNESPAVQARLLMHTASRGLKHPIRALRSVKRQVTSR